MTDKNRRVFFALMFALVFYVTGGYFVETFVNYPTWRMIGVAEFKAYHNELGPRIIRFMVAPWFVEIALTFLLIRYRPRAIPLLALLVAQALNLIALASSIFIQIPIQLYFGKYGMSVAELDRLIATDPIRWVSLSMKIIIYLWMMVRLVRTLEGEQRETVSDEFGARPLEN